MKKPPSLFLTAEWRKLIMANYTVDPELLMPYLPAGTILDEWNGNTYVSLVGFMFKDVKVMGMKIPFHTQFPEVNLRFYVRYKENGEWKRGVTFISEIVPKRAITFVANTIFKENYRTLPMDHKWANRREGLHVGYEWRLAKEKNFLDILADPVPLPLQKGSAEEFITQHFWGYSKIGQSHTGEYNVAHPEWDIYTVKLYHIECDFGKLYGNEFSFLKGKEPDSVFMAEGSPVQVYSKKVFSISS